MSSSLKIHPSNALHGHRKRFEYETLPLVVKVATSSLFLLASHPHHQAGPFPLHTPLDMRRSDFPFAQNFSPCGYHVDSDPADSEPIDSAPSDPASDTSAPDLSIAFKVPRCFAIKAARNFRRRHCVCQTQPKPTIPKITIAIIVNQTTCSPNDVAAIGSIRSRLQGIINGLTCKTGSPRASNLPLEYSQSR